MSAALPTTGPGFTPAAISAWPGAARTGTRARHQRTTDLLPDDRHVRRRRQLLRRPAGRLQLHAANQVVLGAEIDTTFPAWPTSRAAQILLASPLAEAQTSPRRARRGELRRDHAGFRHGARPYRLRTGELAVLRDRRIRPEPEPAIADASSDRREAIALVWRLGWTARAGAEMPIAPHWMARFQYMFTDYGSQRCVSQALGRV